MTSIGFIGTGLMGTPMARNLMKKHKLSIYNRTRERAAALIEEGAIFFDTAKSLAENTDIIIMIVSDDSASEEIILGNNGILSASNKVTIVNMSTLSRDTSIKLARNVQGAGMRYLEAPVAGSTGPAAQATLKILVGGDKDLFDELRGILGLMGDKLFYAGEMGNAAILKLLINTNLAVQMAILSETLVLGEKLGLDPELVLDAFNNTAIKTIVSQFKGPNMLESRYPVAFPYEHMLKDVRYTTLLGENLPLTKTAKHVYEDGLQFDLARMDFSAVKIRYEKLD